MKDLAEGLSFKGAINEPDIYLGARLKKKMINGKACWTMSSNDYIDAAIANLEQLLGKTNRTLPKKCKSPMSTQYIPELDNTPELNANDVQLYQELIGILRWASEIGRVDILHELTLLSSYQASPREGHLEQIYHIFGYLKGKGKMTLYFDPALPPIDPSSFTGSSADAFRTIYRGAQEQKPDNAPEPRGRSVKSTAFVDASHAANKVTRCSHTGFIIFVNRAPVIWYSKAQTTVESSTFSSEFIALKTCTEHISALRYKLRMFGVPIDGPTDVLCDNQSVVTNSTLIDSSLNKKHCSIAYHACRWAVAAEMIREGSIL